ncbi:MAG: hypothetical protein PHR77_15780 [Kiritimatiellae bacterium]|nr:hypothetical protein [Kiritimatiellia bacterium]MDD5520688.1 hypothetical protein [Kiritimatiellia bacterium]
MRIFRLFILFFITVVSVVYAGSMRASDAPNGNDITWRLAGPGGGGWIQSIAFDPLDPDILYVGCDVGGFYFSTDSGRTYTIRNNGLHDYFIESIAVHPKDNNIIILGTESGIHRTTDRGKTWQWIRTGFPPIQGHSFSAPIGAVCFNPIHPAIVYAGIGRPRQGKNGKGTIYASGDTGLTWRLVSAGQLPSDAIVSDIEVKPDNSKIILAATTKGIFRSDDEGKTWKSSSEGLPLLRVEEIAFAVSSPDVVYASLCTTARDKEPWNGGVYRSDDAGRTWRSANGEGMPHRVGKANQPRQMTSTIKEIVVDPRDANVVYAGNTSWVTAGLLKTIDGGRHWQRTTVHSGTNINMEYGWIKSWGPSVECMAISSIKPDSIVFGTSGHIFATEDTGKSWQQRYYRQLPNGNFAGTGLEVTCLNDIVPDPIRPRRLYFCYMDIGLLISDDEGHTFRRSIESMKHPGNCFRVAVDPKSPNTIWAGTGEWGSNMGDICRSDDDGKTWRVVGKPETGLPVGQTRHPVLDLKSPVGNRRLLVTSKGNGIFESRDGGDSWRCINGNLTAETIKEPRGLLLDPADSDHIIVALAGDWNKGAGIYETGDNGGTWSRVDKEPLFSDIQSLVIDPNDLKTRYVCTREHYDKNTRRMHPGGLFKSVDGGITWQRILDFRFVRDVAINPADSRILYAATTDHPYHDNPLAEGLLKSMDGGITWRHENTGLSHRNISCVSVNPHDSTQIYIGTGGNSVFIGKDCRK